MANAPTAGQDTNAAVARGVGLAVVSAVLFGATAPFLKSVSTGLHAIVVAAFLYLGAGLMAVFIRVRRGPRDEAALAPADFPRLAVVAVLGAIAGPVFLVCGLKSMDALRASLLLTLEAPLTVVLAEIAFHEYVSRRVWVAVAAITGGAMLLSHPALRGGTTAGDLFVILACLAWALDNTLSRRLADRDPLAVVAAKGLIGGTVSLLVAQIAGWMTVGIQSAAYIMLVGALGYGLSLQLYLRAQRIVGTARAASVFAIAPFVGAAVALALGAPLPGPLFVFAAGLMALGIWLHATERHRHEHVHPALDHDHVHVHDDGHHTHAHDFPVNSPHSHPHHHESTRHVHEHSEDLHHRHRH